MAAAHTPGPWFYQEESDRYTHIVRTGPSKGDKFLLQLSQDPTGTSEANGRLIAAAPELADALLSYVNRARQALSAPSMSGTAPSPELLAAEAALRKAGRLS